MPIRKANIYIWITCSLVLMKTFFNMTQVSGRYSNLVFPCFIRHNVTYSVCLDKLTNTSSIDVVVRYQGLRQANGNCAFKYCLTWSFNSVADTWVYLDLNISNANKAEEHNQLDINVHLNCSAGNDSLTVLIDMIERGNATLTMVNLEQIHIGTSLVCLFITILTIVVICLHIYNNRVQSAENFESECSDDEELCPQTFEIGFIQPYSDAFIEDKREEDNETKQIKSNLKTEPLKLQQDFRKCFLQEIQVNMEKFKEKTKMRQQAATTARRSLVVSSADVDQADSLSFQPVSIQELLTLHGNAPTGRGERLQRQQSESSQILGNSFLREEDDEWMIVQYEVPVYKNCVHTITLETRQLSITDDHKSVQLTDVGGEPSPAACCSRDSSSSSVDASGYVKMSRSPQLDDSGYAKPFRLENIEIK